MIFDEMENLWPDSSDEAKEELLWITPYPCVSANDVIKRLREFRLKYGENILDAINGEMQEFDRIWKETKLDRERNDV